MWSKKGLRYSHSLCCFAHLHIVQETSSGISSFRCALEEGPFISHMAAFEYWYSLLVLCTPGEDAPRTKEGEKDGQEQHPVHHAQGYDQQDHLPARPGKFKVHLKGQCHTILTSGLFHKQVSPKPLSIPFADIFTAQGTLPVFS